MPPPDLKKVAVLRGSYLVLRLPPPAKKSPAIVAKPMTRGAIRFTIAAMYDLRWFGSGMSPANALDFESHHDLRAWPLNPPIEGTTAP